VSKKSHQVGEAAAPYTAKPTAKVPAATLDATANTSTSRYAKPEDARSAAAKVFKVHEELFRKLAQ